jgi:hypothetical protein
MAVATNNGGPMVDANYGMYKAGFKTEKKSCAIAGALKVAPGITAQHSASMGMGPGGHPTPSNPHGKGRK